MIIRQTTKLEIANQFERVSSLKDGRVRTARLTARDLDAIGDLCAARRRLLDRVLADWAENDREALARSLLRFARASQTAVKSAP